MNRFLILSLIFIVVIQSAEATTRPHLVNVPLTKAYLVKGFDDNDRVQIVVEGTFDNTCYRVATTKAKVGVDPKTNAKTIQVRGRAFQYDGNCLEGAIPFTQVVNVGIVPAGDYTVVDQKTGTKLGQLTIDVAKSLDADDVSYAPITDANVVVGENGNRTLELKAVYGDNCTKYVGTTFKITADTIVVRPEVERTGKGSDCKPGRSVQTHTKALPGGAKGTYLLHVRVMNGQAINKIVDLE